MKAPRSMEEAARSLWLSLPGTSPTAVSDTCIAMIAGALKAAESRGAARGRREAAEYVRVESERLYREKRSTHPAIELERIAGELLASPETTKDRP